MHQLFEISKSDLIKLINTLDDIEDSKTLDGLETYLRKTEVNEKLDELRSGSLRNLDSKSWEFFKVTLMSKQFGYGELIEYLDLVNNPAAKIKPSSFERSGSGSLLSLVPSKLSSNVVFQETLPNIMTYSAATASGQGAGELFFLIYGLNATKMNSTDGADVNLNGWKLEIKSTGSGLKSSAGTEKSTQGAESRIVDSLNNEFKEIIKQNNWDIQGTEKSPRLTKGWFPQFWHDFIRKNGQEEAVKLMNHYITSIYKIPNATEMSKKVLGALGSNDADKVWSSEIITMNKDNSGWDSVIIINTKNSTTLEYANFLDGNSLPSNVITQPMLSRGKGTFAYPDGYIGLGLKGATTSDQEEVRSDKRQKSLTVLDELKQKFLDLTSNFEEKKNNLSPGTSKKLKSALDDVSNKLDEKTKELEDERSSGPTMKGLSTTIDKLESLMSSIDDNSLENTSDVPKENPSRRNKKPTDYRKTQNVVQQPVQQKQITGSSQDILKTKLSDINNPITQELNNIKKNAPDEYNDAVKEVGYEIDKGATDEQIVAFLSDYLNESQIKRLKYLIKY